MANNNENHIDGWRTAVIAIHGVADQRPGDTARAVAHLLASGADTDIRYSGATCEHLVLGVPLLCPANVLPKAQAAPEKEVPENQCTAAAPARDPVPVELNKTGKALRQSLTSDFQRAGWLASGEAMSGARAAATPAPARANDIPATMAQADLGIAFSDYLLSKAARNGSPDESCEVARVRMTRSAGDGTQQVDVHEMYWADLSRMSGLVPRIIGELFTLLFRFSRLGRDAIDQTALERKGNNAPLAPDWTRLAHLQGGLDWAFAALLSQLFLQVSLLLAAIALINAVQPYEWLVHGAVTVLVPLAVLAWYYFRRPGTLPQRLLVGAGAAALTVLLALTPPPLLLGFGVLGMLSALCVAGLRVAEQRFPSTELGGLLFLGITWTLIGAGLVYFSVSTTLVLDATQVWLVACMRAFEFLLLGIIAWWSVVPLIMLAWLVEGAILIGRDPARRAAVVTGQLALFGSLAAFLVLTMALWAVLNNAAIAGAVPTIYDPLFFGNGPVNGDLFLNLRYEKSTQSFVVVAMMLLVLAVYLVIMMTPSVLAEMQVGAGDGSRLGRWLSRGYHGLDSAIRMIVGVAVTVGILFGILNLLNRFGAFPEAWFGPLSVQVEALSLSVLQKLVIGAATVTAVFVAFGGILSRVVPWLRLPLDVALDVDNHFREFPRRAIPRARIFSRYAALLEHLVAEGYDEILIVAHSQGSVISAELLRYLSYRARHDGNPHDRVVRLWKGLEGRVSLLTAGCPLRQLYAARFPAQYAWVQDDAGSGRSCAALGVQRWINLYASGDYVGRWLWSAAASAQELDAPGLYLASRQAPSYQHSQLDVCIGGGAHTHYFDADQRQVASWIDALIGARRGVRMEQAA